MTPVIAVFDIGKTNKKILLFDQTLQLVYQHEQKFDVVADEDGFECDDIDKITSWMESELTRFIQGDEYEVLAVNFSTYGASLMFLDEQGERVTPVYNYLKEVSSQIASNLFEAYGGKAEFCRKTASPNNGLLLNSGIQILWLRNEKPEKYARAKHILHFPQYLTYALSKQVCSEPTSIGCHTFMWDYDNMRYHQWVADNNINLPEPINNDQTFTTTIAGQEIEVGAGIHDSSSSLVPYLIASKKPFVLVSTGTWCITMNPFNSEPLTATQLEQDCLCFLTPQKQQVKSSRLFMGHFHEVWADKFASHYDCGRNQFRFVPCNELLLEKLKIEHPTNIFFPNGKESFDEGLASVKLEQFESYEIAYHKLMIDMTALAVKAMQLVIPSDDKSETIYISGGFARNPIFLHILGKVFNNKEIITSEVDNASALGAALVLAEKVKFNPEIKLSK